MSPTVGKVTITYPDGTGRTWVLDAIDGIDQSIQRSVLDQAARSLDAVGWIEDVEQQMGLSHG